MKRIVAAELQNGIIMETQEMNRLSVSEIMKRSRQEAMRRKLFKKRFCIILVVGLLAAAFSFMIFGNMLVNVQAEVMPDDQIKGYTYITVSSQDTLWGIAEKYADSHYESIYQYIREVKNLNGLTTDVIHSGAKIIIPVYVDKSSLEPAETEGSYSGIQ